MANTYTVDPDTGHEMYPTHNATRRQYLLQGRYARDKEGVFYYPRDERGHEFMDDRLGLLVRKGVYEYPKTKGEGLPNYRTDPALPAKQVYEKKGGKWIIGTGLDGHQYYAKDENGDEYYPDSKTYARMADGTVFYAHSRGNETLFPLDNLGNEMYVTMIDPGKKITFPDRYAKNQNRRDETYPKTMINGLKLDYGLEDRYAVAGAAGYYPLDGQQNEFYLSRLDNRGNPRSVATRVLDQYAVTNDGKVILPTVADKPYIDPNRQPAVQETNILGLLVRFYHSASSDHLTDVEVAIKPKRKPMPYSYFDKRTNILKTVRPPGAPLLALPPGAPAPQPCSGPYFKSWNFWIYLIVFLVATNWWVLMNRKNSDQGK